MDFSRDFTLIEGCLTSAQKAVGSLVDVTRSKKDFEEKSQKVVSLLKDITNSVEQSSEHVQRLRKIAIFLLVNTELTVSNELAEDENCGHLVGATPTLSRDLFFKIASSLPFVPYLSEMVFLGPESLSIEVLNIMTANLLVSHFKKETCVLLQTMIIAAFKRILIICKTGVGSAKISELMKCFDQLIKIYYKPAKISAASKSELYLLAGHLIESNLEVVRSCLKEVHNPKTEPSDLQEFYKSAFSVGSCLIERNCNDHVQVMIKELLSLLHYNLNLITVDMWLELTEEKNDETNKTLQTKVSEDMFLCLQDLKLIEDSSSTYPNIPDLISMLSAMATKPKDEDDEIQEADVEKMIINVNSGKKSKYKWWKALLYTENSLYNSASFTCLRENVALTTEEDAVFIIEEILKMLLTIEHETEQDFFIHFVLETVGTLPVSSQLSVAKKFYKVCKEKVFRSSSCFSHITETLNKTIKTSEKINEQVVSDFVNIFFESPGEVLDEMLARALTKDSLTHVMVEIFLKLQVIFKLDEPDPSDEVSIEIMLCSVLKLMDKDSWTASENQNFIILTKELVTKDLINSQDFFDVCLLPKIYASMEASDHGLLNLWLSTLDAFCSLFFKLNNIINTTAIVLIAEVIEACRGDIFHYSSESSRNCQLAIEISQKLMDGMTDLDERSLDFVKENVADMLSPINLVYYGKLWPDFLTHNSESSDVHFKVLCILHLKNINQGESYERDLVEEVTNDRGELMVALIKLLPLLTLEEWRNFIFNFKTLLAQYCGDESALETIVNLCMDALAVLSMIMKEEFEENGDDSAEIALDCCIRIFGSVMKEQFIELQENLTASSSRVMYTKLVELMKSLPRNVKDSCSIIIVNIMTDVLSILCDKVVLGEEKDICGDILRTTCYIDDSEAKKILAKKFLSGLSSK